MSATTTHQFIGTVRVYMPRGYSPIDPVKLSDEGGGGYMVLNTGDACVVESAWALLDGTPILNVRSLETGLNAQVPEWDLPIAVPIHGGWMCPAVPSLSDTLFDDHLRCRYCGGRTSGHRAVRL